MSEREKYYHDSKYYEHEFQKEQAVRNTLSQKYYSEYKEPNKKIPATETEIIGCVSVIAFFIGLIVCIFNANVGGPICLLALILFWGATLDSL